WGDHPLVSPLTSGSTYGPATGLDQHLLVPAGEVGGAVLVYLVIVEGHHVLEVVVLQAVVRDVRRQFRLPAGRRIAEPACHLELVLRIQRDVDELLGLPLELRALEDRGPVAHLEAALWWDD